MTLRFQNFGGIWRSRFFCKCVNSRVPGVYSEKVGFMFDFDEIMKNRDLTNEQSMLGGTVSPRVRFVFKKSVQ